jgi:hypothetical protein
VKVHDDIDAEWARQRDTLSDLKAAAGHDLLLEVYKAMRNFRILLEAMKGEAIRGPSGPP